MEKHEHLNTQNLTQSYINLLLENTLNKTWEKFVCDKTLLNKIERYIYSKWILKKIAENQVLSWFFNHSDNHVYISNDNWMIEYNNFIKLLWENEKTLANELSENLSLNLFRNKENLKKLQYIKENSDITDDIIIIAKNLSVNNQYHNFWHEIWVAEIVIRLCKEENIDRRTLNLLVLAALFHDWWYITQSEIDLEKLACDLCDTYIPNNVFEKLNITRE